MSHSRERSHSRPASPPRPPSALRTRPPLFAPSSHKHQPVLPDSRPPSVIRAQTPAGAPPPAKITAALSTGVKVAKKAPAFRRAAQAGLPSTTRPVTPISASPTRGTSNSPAVYTPEPLTTVTSYDVDVDADGSLEMEDNELPVRETDDKVLVSVRVRPNNQKKADAYGGELAWVVSEEEAKMQVRGEHARAGGAGTNEYRFDNVLTGSDNRAVYNATARAHVRAAMEGFNAVIFAYGQTASGKTFTLTGDDEEPGIIPRAMKDVFSYIRKNPNREFLLRASYLEIYNETIFDLLSPTPSPVHLKGTTLTPLREEVFTSPQGVREILERGEGHRRTATTDWNERSSRSHSIFRLVIESREFVPDASPNPAVPPPTPGGSRLYTSGGKAVQMSILNLIDLAGSEKATSDKERTREGRYINTSLLTLGQVIQILGENSTKGRTDHVPFRSSKLTHMLQPSLSGDARISVICTVNASPAAVTETHSTLGFASRIKRVQLNAVRKEMIDTEALIERYKAEIRALKKQLEEREREAPARHRRLSIQEKKDDSKAMEGITKRINQLKGLIITSNNVDDGGDEPRPVSPSKVDFDLSPYQLREELFAAKRQIDLQAVRILSLENALEQRPLLPADAPEPEKDRLIADLQHQVRELALVTRGYETHLGEPLRAVREDVEREWEGRVERLQAVVREKEAYALECMRALEREKQARAKLEQTNKAMEGFVGYIDSVLSNKAAPAPESRIAQPRPPSSGAAPLSQVDSNKAKAANSGMTRSMTFDDLSMKAASSSSSSSSPVLKHFRAQPSLMEQMPEEVDVADESWEGGEAFEALPPPPKGGLKVSGTTKNKENSGPQ